MRYHFCKVCGELLVDDGRFWRCRVCLQEHCGECFLPVSRTERHFCLARLRRQRAQRRKARAETPA